MGKGIDLKFGFGVVNPGGGSDDSIKAECEVCGGLYGLPEGGIGTTLGSLLVCPTCVMHPRLASRTAEMAAKNGKQRWYGDSLENPEVTRKKFLALAAGLRRIESATDIPGGITAQHLAAASRELTARRGAGKVA